MATTVAERLQQGAGYVEKLADNARGVLPEDVAEQIGTRMAQIGRRARHGLETASDVRDGVRIAIERHPFAAIALACGVGALFGVVVGRLAAGCDRDGAPTAPQTDDADVEC